MEENNTGLFKNKTLIYRFNGFAHACKMKNIAFFSDAGIIFDKKGFDNKKNGDFNNEHGYIISINRGKDNLKDKYYSMIKGQYDDLSFTFINYFTKKIAKDKIYEIPFFISLVKKIDNYTYNLEIETIKKEETKFTIKKYRETKNETFSSESVFYANIIDFSNILKLIKSFVYNPELVFLTYNEIRKEKKITFTTNNINKAIMKDENLDKPVGKVKKFVKMIMDSK